MDEYKCGDCFHADLCEKSKMLVGFSRDNPAYCGMFLNSADVAPVKHGRWICIRKGYGEYECSVCHGVDSDCSDYYGTHVVTEQDYCPNCGSRMDGDDDE